MPTPAEIRAAIDTRLTDLGGRISTAQSSYLRANGRYAQGLRTHTTIPADGAEVAPDRLSAHPTDQAASWQTLAQIYGLSIPSTFLSALTVDTYDGPRGQGYTVTVEVLLSGQRWRRVLNVGPEVERAYGWHAVVQAAL